MGKGETPISYECYQRITNIDINFKYIWIFFRLHHKIFINSFFFPKQVVTLCIPKEISNIIADEM